MEPWWNDNDRAKPKHLEKHLSHCPGIDPDGHRRKMSTIEINVTNTYERLVTSENIRAADLIRICKVQGSDLGHMNGYSVVFRRIPTPPCGFPDSTSNYWTVRLQSVILNRRHTKQQKPQVLLTP